MTTLLYSPQDTLFLSIFQISPLFLLFAFPFSISSSHFQFIITFFSSSIMSEIYVTGLPFSATETEIKECFNKYGEAETVSIIRYDDNRSKGRAFVVFKTEEDADKVFENRKNIQLQGRKLFLDFTGSKSVFGKKLFVKGLPFQATFEEIKELEVFEKVLEVEVLKFPDGRSKGCGYSDEIEFTRSFKKYLLLLIFCEFRFHLTFPTFEDAEIAFDNRNSASLGGRRLWLDFTGPRSRFKSRQRNPNSVSADNYGGSSNGSSNGSRDRSPLRH